MADLTSAEVRAIQIRQQRGHMTNDKLTTLWNQAREICADDKRRKESQKRGASAVVEEPAKVPKLNPSGEQTPIDGHLPHTDGHFDLDAKLQALRESVQMSKPVSTIAPPPVTSPTFTSPSIPGAFPSPHTASPFPQIPVSHETPSPLISPPSTPSPYFSHFTQPFTFSPHMFSQHHSDPTAIQTFMRPPPLLLTTQQAQGPMPSSSSYSNMLLAKPGRHYDEELPILRNFDRELSNIITMKKIFLTRMTVQ
eukprot:c7063_g1_i1.p1 GENE.c7063_g1_i1~~c7063_g1_i1.p1  ORF type:complete len:252 (-),score=47.62 c7063_g1_i1:65-820(-)